MTQRTVDLDQARRRIGRIGVWSAALGALPAAQEREQLQHIEELGYTTVWITEMEKEAFAHSALALAATKNLTVATGIANMWAREPETAASGANALGEAFDGRFVLGVGISHARFVERYQKPLAKAREYLGRMVDTQLLGSLAPTSTPWLIAALRPKMLELSASHAQGAHPYFVPVEHTASARKLIGPDALLAPELAVVLDSNPETARATARGYMSLYLALPNYTNNLLELGFTDDDFASGGSDRLVDAVIAWGDVDAIKRRVDDHLAAGADHVCIQPLTDTDRYPGGRFPTRELVELAPVLLGR